MNLTLLNCLFLFYFTLSVSQNLIFQEENDVIANYVNNLSVAMSKTHPGGYIGVVISNGTETADIVLKYLHQNISGKIAVLNFNNENYINDLNEVSKINNLLAKPQTRDFL